MLAWVLLLDFAAGPVTVVTIGDFLCFFSESLSASTFASESISSGSFNDESLTVCS